MATKKRAAGRRLQLGEGDKDSSSAVPAAEEGEDEIVGIVEPETPTKRSRRHDDGDDDKADDIGTAEGGAAASSRFFTPRKKSAAGAATAATITPSPAAKKRALLTETVHPEKKKKAKKRTTVAEELAAAADEEEPYVPKHIHANVGYTRFGASNNHLSNGQKMAFNCIADNYILPRDFETNRKYGPLSGVSYEERAIAAYATNMLEAKEDADAKLLRLGVCSWCGTVGHKKVRCPDLI